MINIKDLEILEILKYWNTIHVLRKGDNTKNYDFSLVEICQPSSIQTSSLILKFDSCSFAKISEKEVFYSVTTCQSKVETWNHFKENNVYFISSLIFLSQHCCLKYRWASSFISKVGSTNLFVQSKTIVLFKIFWKLCSFIQKNNCFFQDSFFDDLFSFLWTIQVLRTKSEAWFEILFFSSFYIIFFFIAVAWIKKWLIYQVKKSYQWFCFKLSYYWIYWEENELGLAGSPRKSLKKWN